VLEDVLEDVHTTAIEVVIGSGVNYSSTAQDNNAVGSLYQLYF